VEDTEDEEDVEGVVDADVGDVDVLETEVGHGSCTVT
jgi:hypothetical protein